MTTLLGRAAALAAAVALACAAGAGAAEPATQPGRQAQEQPARAPQPPVRISAESAEYFNAENLVVFTGKVVAVQADTTITAERMEVRFAPPAGATGATGGQAAAQPAAEQPGAAGAATGQRIASITALQSVTFRQVDQESGKERYATGEQGIYDAERRTVTLTGAPRLWEGKNVIVGEQMVFHLEDKKVVVKGKVNLVVYPDEAKDAGKGKTSP